MNDIDSRVERIQKTIGYTFTNRELLRQTFTHSSYVHEADGARFSDYERLEFLGDAVLGMIVSEYLYAAYPEHDEGQLTRIKCAVVSESTLARVATDLALGSHMLLGRGEMLSGGRQKTSLLADTFEAVTAAIYLDGGWDAVRAFVLEHLKPQMNAIREGMIEVDYKSLFQEAAQRIVKRTPAYMVIHEYGPDHDKRFEVKVVCGSKEYGRGIGRSKKEAEQNAAKQGLVKLGEY
jgi:ribonuclease-3